MKKTILVVAIAAIVMGLASCKAHERCPAYGSKVTSANSAGKA
jgi:hypothetical protein